MAYLGGKCHICGYNRSLNAMDFHHTTGLGKDFSISAKMTSWEVIEPELRKCVLLCANCHREVHEGLHSGYLMDESHERGDDRQMEMFDDGPLENPDVANSAPP